MAEAVRAEVDALLARAVASGEVPGVVAMVTDREGPIYRGAFGQRALGQAAMTADTMFWLASMTKALTVTVALQLAEEGRFALDDEAARFVPWLGEVGVLDGFDAAGEPILRPARRPITLRHLFTHTAGFSYDFWSAAIGRYAARRGLPSLRDRVAGALRLPLLFDPGDRWSYGIGIDWLGQVVEAVSGMRLGAVLHERLLGPLAMDDTGFALSAGQLSRLALIHQRGADGRLRPPAPPPPAEPPCDMGGGGAFGTMGDYLAFIRMILNGGAGPAGPILRPETVALMTQDAIAPLAVTALRSARPDITNDVDFFPGQRAGWTLGFLINAAEVPGGRSAGSLAWAGLANTYYWIDPARGIGGVFATQILPFADRSALPLCQAFERAVYQGAAAR